MFGPFVLHYSGREVDTCRGGRVGECKRVCETESVRGWVDEGMTARSCWAWEGGCKRKCGGEWMCEWISVVGRARVIAPPDSAYTVCALSLSSVDALRSDIHLRVCPTKSKGKRGDGEVVERKGKMRG